LRCDGVYFRFEESSVKCNVLVCFIISELFNDIVFLYSMSNRPRSAAWEFFSKTGNANLAKCHICDSILAYSGTTTNLLKHLRAKHYSETAEVMQWDSGEDRTETDVAVDAITSAPSAASDDVNENDVGSRSPVQRTGPRKNRSVVWKCFRKVIGTNYAECLFCGVHISQENGTTTCLMKHFMAKHPDVYAMQLEYRSESVSSVMTIDYL